MERLLIRHGETDADTRDRSGPHDQPLNERGRIQAVHIRPKLSLEDNIDITTTPVAVSELQRTRQTAQAAGAQIIRSYTILNPLIDLTLEQRDEFRETGILPQHVLDASQNILDNFPEERILVMHGLPITGICKILGIYQELRHPYPDFCEIRVADI